MSVSINHTPAQGRAKSWLLIFAATGLALLGVAVIILDLMVLKDALLRDLQVQARVVARTVNVNLWFDSSFDSSEMTDILGDNTRIVEAALFDRDGQIVVDEVGDWGRAVYQRDPSEPFVIPEQKAERLGYRDGSLVVFEPIVFKADGMNDFLGTVYIRADVSDLLESHARFLGLFIFLVVLTAYVLSRAWMR